MGNPPSRNNRQPSSSASNNTDYGSSDQYIQKADYDGTMEVVNKRLEALEARVKDRPAVIATLKDVLENDRNVDAILIDFIKQHIDLKPTVRAVVDNMDKRLIKAFMKKTGIWVLGGIWSVILIVVTVWVTKNIG